MTIPPQQTDKTPSFDNFINPINQPKMGDIMSSYEKLAIHLMTKEKLKIAEAVESDNFVQCHKATNISGTNPVFFLDHDAIKTIPNIIIACIVWTADCKNLTQNNLKSQLDTS